MRLWTIHPKYLDVKGLVALWREGLLAKAVLEGKTKGYRNHPQLIRFKAQNRSSELICEYLHHVLIESQKRGYRFDSDKLPSQTPETHPIRESKGQLEYEWRHLLCKLRKRDSERFDELSKLEKYESHPLFTIVPGKVKDWENTI
jgi:hypothetical protein